LLHYIINWLGFAVCHQLPARTFHYGLDALPICARCTGIYVGLLAGLVYLIAANRKRESGFPPWWALAFGVVGIGLMGIDGVSSYAGWRPTSNELRLITGLLAGSALPLVLLPMFNYQAWKNASEERIIKGWADFGLYLLVIVAAWAAFQYRPEWLFWPFYFLNGAAIVLAFVITNMILVMLLPWWSQQAERWRQLIVPMLIGAAMGFVELAGSYYLHALALRLVARG
jgi:uncharacterized membrane protein